MSTPHRPVVVLRTVVALASLGLTVSGCAFGSPTTITTPYAASDGTNAELDGPGGAQLKFLNFLLVTDGTSRNGTLSGAVVTGGTVPVPVQLQVFTDPKAQPLGTGSVTVTPGELVKLGAEGTSVPVTGLTAKPGQTVSIRASTSTGGKTFPLPVVAASGPYASLAPSTRLESETPSVSASGSASAAGAAKASSSASAAATSSPTP